MKGRSTNWPLSALVAMTGLSCLCGAMLDDRRIAVNVLEAEGPTGLTANASLTVDRIAVTDTVEFRGDLDYVAPASGLDMGGFVQVGWWLDQVEGPIWWRLLGVVDPYLEPNDYAAACQGQVKWMAECAAGALELALVDEGGAGAEIENLVASFSPSNNLLPVALGQLKNVAEPFWRRMRAVDPSALIPWSTDGDDMAMVNVGQVKRAFAFDFPVAYWERILDEYGGTNANSNPLPAATPASTVAVRPATVGAVVASTAPVDDDRYRYVEFHFGGGSWASWELKVIGDGPYDFEERSFSNNHQTQDQWFVDDRLRLRKGNRYRLSARWLNGEDAEGRPCYWLDFTIDRMPSEGHQTFSWDEDRENYQRNDQAQWIYGDGWVIDNRSGLVCMSYASSSDDGAVNQLASLEATIYVLDDPCLAFDYDRNRIIDADDIARAQDGSTVFRFWYNDDYDKRGPLDTGAACSACEDDFRGNGHSNLTDLEVNGKRDLVDFTPLMIDFSTVFPDGLPRDQRRRIVWTLRSDCLNLVWTKLQPNAAGSFLIKDVGECGPELKQSAYCATCEHMDIDHGVDLTISRKILDYADDHEGRIVALVEGWTAGSHLDIRGSVPSYFEDAEGALTLRHDVALRVFNVTDMVRSADLRAATTSGFDLDELEIPGEPCNRPDSECKGPHYVFVHGYNVNYDEGVAWGHEMFKRLWQSGLQSRYTMVLWQGSDSQRRVFNTLISPNYYGNVKNAFLTAEAFSRLCGQLPGPKVLMAHSLGNMLVSAAAKDYGLEYRRYYMLNAAVASEAFAPEATSSVMLDYEWNAAPAKIRASRWYMNFGVDDFRHGLSWKGRFQGLKDVVNYYSASDEVVGRPRSLFGLDTAIATTGCAWSKQELYKGCEMWELAGGVNFASVACEGGWGIKSRFRTNPLAYDPLTGLHGLYFDGFTSDMCITNHVFTDFRDEQRLASLERIAPDVDGAYAWRAELLGTAIPAESFSVGSGPVTGLSNRDFKSCISDSWSWTDIARLGRKWYHSDIKDLAYQYVYKFFDQITSDAKEMQVSR